MKINKMVGNIIKVKFIERKDKYYIGKTIDDKYIVAVDAEDDDYEDEEIIDSIEKCIVLDEKDKYIKAYILSNRKFVNDLKKINDELKDKEEANKIEDIYLVERLNINGKIVGLYLVDEGDVAKYYLGTKEIGIYMKKMRENNILFKENTIENEIAKNIRDVVMTIDLRKKEISLIEEQEKQKHIIEKAIGLELEREITRIATVDLNEKFIEKEEDLKEQQKQAKEKNINYVMNHKEMKSINDVNIKQELDTKDKVTDMKNLGQLLEKEGKLPKLEGDKFVKIGIIESDQRDNLLDSHGNQAKENTTRYAFVAISNKGKVVPLDIEQDHTEGNNPRETNYQISQNGKIEKDDVLSRYKIGNGTLAVKNGKYGEIKVYHSPRKTIGGKDIEGNKSLDRELETNNVWEIKKAERDLASDIKDGYRSVEEGYQEARKHEQKNGTLEDGETIGIDDIDGEKNTRTHVHDNVDYEKLAVKWGYYKDGKPNDKRAQELFEEKRKENPKKETEEIIEMVTEELEEEISNNRDER